MDHTSSCFEILNLWYSVCSVYHLFILYRTWILLVKPKIGILSFNSTYVKMKIVWSCIKGYSHHLFISKHHLKRFASWNIFVFDKAINLIPVVKGTWNTCFRHQSTIRNNDQNILDYQNDHSLDFCQCNCSFICRSWYWFICKEF